VKTVPLESFHQMLDLEVPVTLSPQLRGLPLTSWTMDADDQILRQVFRQFRPSRHLEFVTWSGDGVLRVVEECDATVWTINLLEGETKPNGQWAYGSLHGSGSEPGPASSEKMKTDAGTWIRTDAYGQIGRKYLEAGWGKRVCQVYADSREWDTSAYPDAFFDTVFIDGGHAADIVENDTALAVRLTRPGGLVIWHDFCPEPDVQAACGSTQGVVQFISTHARELGLLFEKLFWVSPSWLLFGVRCH